MMVSEIIEVNSSSQESEVLVEFGQEELVVVYKFGVPYRISRFPQSLERFLTDKVSYWNIELSNQNGHNGLALNRRHSGVYTVLFYNKKPAFDGQLLKLNEVYVEGLDFNEGKYYGESLNEIPEGYGILEYKDYMIISKFSNGVPVDQGEIVGYKDLGDFIVSGMIENGKLNGRAEIQFSNGDKYFGEVKNNAIHGKGTYKYCDGSEYEGQFQSDLKHGNGVYKFQDGTLYHGMWTRDKVFGVGRAEQNDQIMHVKWHNN
jgi:hypothetical protein